MIHFFRDRELLTNYFTVLAGLDFNIHHHLLQQSLLDELLDVSITVSTYILVL